MNDTTIGTITKGLEKTQIKRHKKQLLRRNKKRNDTRPIGNIVKALKQ